MRPVQLILFFINLCLHRACIIKFEFTLPPLRCFHARRYEKGAEVIRMYATLLGREGFRKGLDLYFARHDGQAVTCDDFRAAMADASGVNFDQFERW